MKTLRDAVKAAQDIQKESQIAAAFIMEGLHDFGYEKFCLYSDLDGVVEKINDAVEMAEKIGMAVVYAGYEGLSTGVMHYDVSSAYGFRYAEKAVQMGRALTTKEMEVLLHDILREELDADNEWAEVEKLINFVFN